MVRAVHIESVGDPSVLKYVDVDLPEPKAGEVRIRHTAIGLNFIDTYFRSGLYPAPGELPLTLGNEGAGYVVSIGEGVSNLAVGDRVAYAGPLGAYSEERNIPASVLVKIPEGVSDEQAAALMLKGMTACYLLKKTYEVTAETTLLYHAAAGGVGLIVGQWASALGATVIGTVSSAEKARLASAHGYDYVINYKSEDWVERVRAITDGRGCDVVYDSVGKDTFPASLDCIRKRGLWCSFGQSSGPLPEFNLALLSQKGSLFATRPSLFDYISERWELEETAADLFSVVADGTVDIQINQRYALKDIAQAHRDLEGRKTTGATVIIP
ncbi:Quinone oxidoreductase 1 [Pseudovibrio axinellae]|uniref:Quinone oxidoreductase 1 n=1 Tax=Pseudovibrio axinellae TaxID=989403 RepID=A0A165XBX7_9HYPH|nr:quinone oxidoreductase [Pseudovibrio axinellae]KZL17556.1 Quinone oxidoreductase 1 [Pseudovibrio axinellae]SER32827.1 NADPH2:quinone reductase [Pseudovibrio axinellae]